MECNKIKSLLSEYLDKTLQSDLSRDVKTHLLSCKNCSNDFFLMKSITGELADLEIIKAPGYLLNRVNQAVQSRSWFARIFDFIPGSGGFKLPMEFVTLATTVALVFLIFTNIHVDKNENTMIAKSGDHKTIAADGSNSPIKLDFIPAGSKNSEVTSDNVISVARGRSSGNGDTTDPFSMFDKEMPVLNHDSLISWMGEMTLLAGGNVVRKEQSDTGYIESITVQIPSDNYDSFINQLNKMGRFHPPAPSVSHKSPETILLHIRLNLSE